MKLSGVVALCFLQLCTFLLHPHSIHHCSSYIHDDPGADGESTGSCTDSSSMSQATGTQHCSFVLIGIM